MPARTITLRAGTVVAAALLAAVPLAGVASAAPAADRDCADFPTQTAAQAALLANPSDPDGLDADDNGIACENHSAPAGPDQVPAVPSGSVDAGDGSGSTTRAGEDLAASFLLVGFGVVVAAGAGTAVWRTRRPGPFARLRDLSAGDLVEIGRADGSTATFEVQAVRRYPKDRFPTGEV